MKDDRSKETSSRQDRRLLSQISASKADTSRTGSGSQRIVSTPFSSNQNIPGPSTRRRLVPIAPAPPRPRPTPPTTRPPLLDTVSNPAVIRTIVAVASRPTLLALRKLSRSVCREVDAAIGLQLVFEARGSRDGNAANDFVKGEGVVRITDLDGRRIPALRGGFRHLSARQVYALRLARVITLLGTAGPHSFDNLMAQLTGVHTAHYRVRGYLGPLPRSLIRVIIRIPQRVDGDASRWSLGPLQRAHTLVLNISISQAMGAGFVLQSGNQREVVFLLTDPSPSQHVSGPQRRVLRNTASLPAMRSIRSSSERSPQTYQRSLTSKKPTASSSAASFSGVTTPFVSLTPQSHHPVLAPTSETPSTPIPTSQSSKALSHIILNIARTIHDTRFLLVGIALVPLSWVLQHSSSNHSQAQSDIHNYIIQAVVAETWRGDLYGSANHIERHVRSRITFLSHDEYRGRIGSRQYDLEMN